MTCQVVVDLKADKRCGKPLADALALDGRDASAIVLVCERHARMWDEQAPHLIIFEAAPSKPVPLTRRSVQV